MTELSQRLAKLTPEQRTQLEARLRERQTEPSPKLAEVAARPETERALLSFAQERLWVLEQLEGASANYTICYASRLRGNILPVYLENALKEIIQRHESLRTCFVVSVPGQPPTPEILATSDFHLEIVDLSAESPENKEVAAKQTLDKIACRPISFARDPLVRAHLVQLDRNDHILMVTVHHIIADGWSFDVLFRELSVLYADLVSGRQPSLPPLKIQYADFAVWQRRQHLQEDAFKKDLHFWKNRLEGIPTLLEIPTDFPRPAEQSYRGAACEQRLGLGLMAKIRRLMSETDTTLFMMVMAAFQALLHRYSGQTDILVGTPVTSRNRVEFEPLIGLFVNMLPVRLNFSGAPTVRELLQKTRQTTLELLSHREVPFELLVRELRPERNLAHAPLFQAALMLQQNEHRSLQLPGVVAELFPIDTASAKFDLTLAANDTPSGLQLGLEYSIGLFTSETARRMLNHLEYLFESMVANPDQRISEISFLSAAERQQILVEWNHTSCPYPSGKTVHALFDEQAARTPHAIAIEFGRQRLRYSELAQRVNILADALRNNGVTAESRVGIYIERSIDMVVGVLGILKAGGVYLPLDPAYPKNRLAYIVADADLRVLVTQSKLVDELPEHHAQVICIDNSNNSAPATTTNRQAYSATAENLAYILYTSGSTGKPKGVEIPHRAVVNLLHSMRQAPGLCPTDTLLAVTTLSFDIAGLELFLPLTTGAKVVVASREQTMDATLLAALLEKSGATVMQATPATWRLLLDSGWKGNPSLKILCGGEAMDRALANRLLERCGELWNMYGPTETTIWSTTERMLPGQPITIGRPIANTQTYILDNNLQPLPQGVVGELYIGGDGLARGYLNRPELTKAKFITVPFGTNGATRLYRTGDLARFVAGGRIDFIGRTDHQVKIRGFRIETGEIETTLAGLPEIGRAAVIVHETGPSEKRLVAYIVPKSTSAHTANGKNGYTSAPTLNPSAVRTALRQTLPDYMIPAAFVILESLPLTPNGKLDRKALPAPEPTALSENGYQAPVGPTEEKLASIIGSLLHLPKVGRKDDFFDLGGHSVLAVALFNEIERDLGLRTPLATLFRAPTVERLATVLDGQRNKAEINWPSLVSVQTSGSKMRFFCVHGAGGNVLLYRDLARSLGKDYPFYGLQSQGLDNHGAPLRTIEEMAERYIEEIRALQPDGPYCLGGYCLGGTIAYEMSRRLVRQGHEVALVAMFDTYNFAQMKKPSPPRLVRQKIAFHWGNIARLSWKDLPGYFASKLRVGNDGEFKSMWSAVKESLHVSRRGKETRSIEASVQEINDRAAEIYRPGTSSGVVTLFKPKVNYDFYPDPQMGWSEIVTGGLDIVELPVNPHAMLVAPFVQHLARELKQRIDRATSRKEADISKDKSLTDSGQRILTKSE